MEIEPLRVESGELKAWGALCGLDREDVCTRTLAMFDGRSGCYLLNCFGTEFSIDPCARKISCQSDSGVLFLDKLKNFFGLSVLSYLSNAKDIPPSGRLVRPVDVKGGQIFSAGTHVLPLNTIAEKFAEDPRGFLDQGKRYGGEPITGNGDAALLLFPFPRVPVTMILWVRDEEFSSRVDLFFDSTCEFQIAGTDIIWAAAMMCSLIMVDDGATMIGDQFSPGP